MKTQTKLLLCTSMVLLIAIPFIATTFVDATGQETNATNTRGFKGIVGWLRQRWGRYGYVEGSERFKANAITIATSDQDVQELLNSGYSIIGVRPIIKSIVDDDGDVLSKATHAVVILKNEETMNFAVIWVDMNTSSVLKIVTLTRTVTDKS